MADNEQNNENENEPVEVPESSDLQATGSGDSSPDLEISDEAVEALSEVVTALAEEGINAPDAPQTPAKRPYRACAAANAAAKNKRKYG